jgi:hypothetical protein
LIKCEHHNQLDRKELGKWPPANQLIFCETVEQEQAVERDTTDVNLGIEFCSAADRPYADKINGRKIDRSITVVESVALAKNFKVFADHASYGRG